MNCKEFNEQLLELNDINNITNEMKEHIKSCETCAHEFELTKRLFNDLKPKHNLKTPDNFTENILLQLESPEKKKNIFVIKSIAKIAAVFIFAFLLGYLFIVKKDNQIVNSATAAENIFNHSIKFFKDIKTIYIKYKVKTLPQDNFEYLDLNCDFVEHTLIKEFTGKKRWKIEKTERVVAFDGKQKYLYIKNVGLAEIGDADINYVQWMKKLLYPENIFKNELQNAKNCDSCKYNLSSIGNLLVLEIFSKAKGDYTNPYLKNTSFDDSDNKTIYTFSKNDTVLQSVKFYIIKDNKEYLMLDINKIQYNLPLNDDDFKIKLAEGVKWHKTSLKKDKEFIGITSKEAAEIFFKSISKGDWKSISAFFPDFEEINDKQRKELINQFKGLKIIYIKESFKSGQYPGEFVPYEIVLSSGDTIEHKLAVRNDNEYKIWLLDGGF